MNLRDSLAPAGEGTFTNSLSTSLRAQELGVAPESNSTDEISRAGVGTLRKPAITCFPGNLTRDGSDLYPYPIPAARTQTPPSVEPTVLRDLFRLGGWLSAICPLLPRDRRPHGRTV